MEKQFNKISTAEMKKNMSEDTMTICECCEFLEMVLRAIYRQMMELGWI